MRSRSGFVVQKIDMEDARNEQRRVNAAERRRIKQQDADQAVDSIASKATDPHNVHRVVLVVAWAAVSSHTTRRKSHSPLRPVAIRGAYYNRSDSPLDRDRSNSRQRVVSDENGGRVVKKNRVTERRSRSRQHSTESHGSSQRSSTRSHRGLSSSHATRRKSQDGDKSNSRQRVVADENDGRAVKKNRTAERRSHSRQHSIESRGSSSNRSLRGFSSSRTTRRKSHSPRSSVAIQGL